MHKILSSKKAIVTGASGKIGTELVKKLVSKGVQVYAVSSKNSFSKLEGVTFIPHKWGTPFMWNLPEIDVIFHLASQTSAYIARQDVSQDIRDNLLTTVSLLEAVAKLKSPPVFIFAGSMTEYGMGSLLNIDETFQIDPQTFYDIAKLCSKMYIKQFAKEKTISKGITLRLSNVYGSAKIGGKIDRGFIDKSIIRSLSGKPLAIYGNGMYARDYIHISDVVDAFIMAFQKSENLLQDTYNIGTGISTSVSSALNIIVSTVYKINGVRSPIIFEDFPSVSYPIEERNSIADSSKFIKATGWKPGVLFVDGIEETVKRLDSGLA